MFWVVTGILFLSVLQTAIRTSKIEKRLYLFETKLKELTEPVPPADEPATDE